MQSTFYLCLNSLSILLSYVCVYLFIDLHIDLRLPFYPFTYRLYSVPCRWRLSGMPTWWWRAPRSVRPTTARWCATWRSTWWRRSQSSPTPPQVNTSSPNTLKLSISIHSIPKVSTCSPSTPKMTTSPSASHIST